MSATAPPGPHTSVEGRKKDDANRRAPAVNECQERGKERHALREGLGAVDRVDDPSPAGAPGAPPFLLAEDGVGGPCGRDLVAEEGLRLDVSLRHGRTVPLGGDRQAPLLVPLQRDLARLPRGRDGKVDELFIDWFGRPLRSVGLI